MDCCSQRSRFLRGMNYSSHTVLYQFADHVSYSSSVAPPSLRSTSSIFRTTTRLHGSRTLSLPSPVPPLHWLSLLPSMSSRPESRTAISRTPRAASASCQTWPRMKVLAVSSRDWFPRFVTTSFISDRWRATSLTFTFLATHDRSQAGILLLACTDSDSCL